MYKFASFCAGRINFGFKYTILSKNPVEKEKDFFIPTVVTDCMAVLTASVLMVTFKDEGNFVPCIAVAVIAINWLIHGFLTNDFTEKVLLLSEMALMLVISMWIPASFYTLFVIAIFATFLFMLYKCEDSYLFVFKVFAYVFLMINSIVCPMLFRATLETFDIFITGNVVLLSLAVVNTVFRFTPLVSNPDTDEDDMKVLTIIVDNVLVLYGLMMTFVHNSPADILTGVITLILIPIGTAWIWTDEEDNTVEKYLAVTEYVFVPFLLCYGWNTPAYISSIIGLALAVGCIVLGFGVKMKGIRIYGLAVSMIMIFKLALVDFEKSSFMAYALSFFIAGISCLIISMLYYFVNAAMADKE